MLLVTTLIAILHDKTMKNHPFPNAKTDIFNQMVTHTQKWCSVHQMAFLHVHISHTQTHTCKLQRSLWSTTFIETHFRHFHAHSHTFIHHHLYDIGIVLVLKKAMQRIEENLLSNIKKSSSMHPILPRITHL